MATELQREVAGKVISAWRAARRHYRAARNGERVTLASLYRSGVLARRCWRGTDGSADAAYEYRPSNDLIIELARGDGNGSTAELMPVNRACSEAAAVRAKETK